MGTLRHPVVLFDAGDTLLGPREPFGAIYARVLATLGVVLDPLDLERGLRTFWAEINRTLPSGSDRYGLHPGGEAEYWRRFVAGALQATPGAPDDPKLASSAVDPLRAAFRDPAAWLVFPDVTPTLDTLLTMRVRLGVVSNWDSRLPALLEALDLSRYFDTIVVSHLEGLEKPHPELFRRAVARLGGRCEEALHVGDAPELDAAGARSAGLASVIIDRHGRLDEDAGALRDLRSIPAIVRGGG